MSGRCRAPLRLSYSGSRRPKLEEASLARRAPKPLLRAMPTLRFVSLLVAGMLFTTPPTPPPAYEVYAVRFATEASYPTRYLVVGADSARRTPLAFTVWLMRGGGRTILMDAGFYRDKFVNAWKPEG